MAIKLRFHLTLLFIVIFIFSVNIHAQENNQNELQGNSLPDIEDDSDLNYYIDRSEREPRFIQRLIWQEVEHVLRFEVIVHRRENSGAFTEVERISTDAFFAEVSLPAGRYRYQVLIYDLFDEFSSATAWRDFEIIRAIQPELTSFFPIAFYLDEDDNWEITLRGRNFLTESVIHLVGEYGRVIRPQSRTLDASSARLVFSGDSLSAGKYDVYVRNPGGLDAKMGTFTIGNKKPFDVNISIGYAPIVPLYGFLFKEFNFEDTDVNAPFYDSFYPLSAAAKISFLPFKRVRWNMGFEVAASFSMMPTNSEFYSTNAYLLNTHLSYLNQFYLIRKKLAFNVSVGGGISYLSNFYYEYPDGGDPYEVPTSTMPSAAAGLSFMIFVNKLIYISPGVDFIHIFSQDTPMPGFIRPYALVGIRL